MIIFKDICKNKSETLGEYYISQYSHLIPNDVEIVEYDIANRVAKILKNSTLFETPFDGL